MSYPAVICDRQLLLKLVHSLLHIRDDFLKYC